MYYVYKQENYGNSIKSKPSGFTTMSSSQKDSPQSSQHCNASNSYLNPPIFGVKTHSKATKRFRPNLTGSRTRPSLNFEMGKRKRFCPDTTYLESSGIQNVNNEHNDTEQMEGCEIEEGDTEEGYLPLWGGKKFVNYSDDAKSGTASSVNTPTTASGSINETITELNLGQDDFHKTSSTQGITCPVVENEAEWKSILEQVKEEKGYTFTGTKTKSEDLIMMFTCSLGHSFSIKSYQEIICNKCDKLMAKCLEYAKSYKGTRLFNNRKITKRKYWNIHKIRVRKTPYMGGQIHKIHIL